MLGFFRKYEKTFFLVVFAPAVLSLGITGVMMSMIRDIGREVDEYRVFGDEVDSDQIAALRRSQDQINMVLQRVAWNRIADQYGVYVSDDELVKTMKKQLKNQFMNRKIARELETSGLPTNSREYQQQRMQLFIKYFSMDFDDMVSPEEYREFLKDYKLSPETIEAQTREDLRRQRLIDAAADLARVEPEQLWEEYQKEHHRRRFEVVALEADKFVPSEASEVSDAVIEQYYKENKRRFEEPRRGVLHYLAVDLKALEASLPPLSQEELRAFYDGHPALYKDRDGEARPFESVTASVTTAALAARVQDRAFGILDKARETILAGGVADMAKVASASLAVYGKTEKVSAEEAAENPALGELAEFWLGKPRTDRRIDPAITHRPSDPMFSDSHAVVMWLQDVTEVAVPELDKVRETITAELIDPPEDFVEDYFKTNKDDFKTEVRFELETLALPYARLAKKLEEPSNADLRTFFTTNADKYKDKDFEAVRAEVEQAYRLDRAKTVAAEVIAEVEDDVQKLVRKNEPIDLSDFSLDSSREYNTAFEHTDKDLAKAELSADPQLKNVSATVSAKAAGFVSTALDLPGGAGLFLYHLKKRAGSDDPKFDEVKDEVRGAILEKRGFERAKTEADKIIEALSGLKGKELEAELEARGLSARRSPLFDKSTNSLEGFDKAEDYVAKTFDAEPGGGFSERVVNEDEKRIDLLRCVERVDAPADEFSAKRDELRENLLGRLRYDVQGRWVRQIEADARSISRAHIEHAVELKSGGSKIQKVTVRQVALPPDRVIVKSWLEAEAKRICDGVKEELAGGADFGKLALTRSEDAVTRSNDGIIGVVARDDLLDKYGASFSEAVFAIDTTKLPSPVVGPIKSDVGYHLVRILAEPSRARRRVAHIAVKADKTFRELPKSELEKARQETGKSMNAIAERLKSESFAKVLKDFDDTEDMPGTERGEEIDLEYASPFAIAIQGIVEKEVRGPFKLGDRWQLAIAASDQTPVERESKALAIFHMEFSSEAAAQSARERLFDFMQNYESQGERMEPPWGQVVDKFRELARELSKAPTAKKGGCLGVYEFDERTISYGPEWTAKVMELANTQDAEGKVSGIIKSKFGLHIVEVLKVERPKLVDIDPYGGFEYSIIYNTDWR